MSRQPATGQGRREAGISLFLIAGGLALLLGIAGLAIDLATLYVVRSEAQRAADAAALAGATEFVDASVLSGLMSFSAVQPLAAQKAAQAGNMNLVAGQSPNINPAAFSSTCPPGATDSGCFDFSQPGDPRITVVVRRTVPTFFMKIFGVQAVPISATATAEAYNPGGSGPTTTARCVKPWLMPNCDPSHIVSATDPLANLNCPYYDNGGNLVGYESVIVNNGAIVRPGLTPQGVVGLLLNVKMGSPNSSPAPSKFWPIYLPPSTNAACPACAQSDASNGGNDSGALYRANIECCSTETITCGQQTVQPISGDMVGPTAQGVDCLIHEGSNNSGQDTISLDNSLQPPFQIFAGSNNPYGVAAGTAISTERSDSVATIPIYDGTPLCPGSSCPSSVSVTVVGFLQIFIRGEFPPQHTVQAYILNVTACSSGGSNSGSGGGSGGGSSSITGTSYAPIPVRLIHN